jgi:hypothetical protein
VRAISPQLAADIAAGYAATFVQVSRMDGVTMYFTDHDGPIAIGSSVYQPAAGLSGIKLTITNDASVGDVQTRAAWLPVLSEADILAGLYDNATVSFGFGSWKTPAYGVLWVFSGLLAQVKANQDGFQAQAQSAMWTLQRQLGIYINPTCRHVLGSTIDPQGVGGCLLDLAPYTYTGTITSIINPMVWEVDIPNWNVAATPGTPNAPTASVQQGVAGQYLPPGTYHYSVSSIDANKQESATSPIVEVVVQPNQPPTGGGIVTLNWSPVPGAQSYNIYGNTAQVLMANTTATTFSDNGANSQGAYAPLFGDYFALGILKMTSGAANGMQVDVKTLQGNKLYILLPLGRPAAVGDTFTITAGCPKSVGACQYKFGNVINFGGFPDLTPERQWQ